MARYYFSFSNTTRHPIARLLKDGFQHVEMITDLEGDLIMHVNPRWGRVNYGLTNEIPLPQVLKMFTDLGHTVVFFPCDLPDPCAKIFRGPVITCATYLAYTIGISFFGVTPYQLYKTLLSRGGEVL